MKKQPKKLTKNACLTAAGVGLQLLGNLCFAVVTARVVKEFRAKHKNETRKEIRE